MKQSGLLKRREASETALFHLGMECGEQKIIDYLCIALHDPDVMGKDTFGEARLLKLITAIYDQAKKYQVAYTDEPEADYWQEKLDRELRGIFGEKADPFPVRQPSIKIFKTGGKKIKP